METQSTQTGVSSWLGKDLLASIVVFLVALPLCLGIALASGAPLMSGLIAGIVGGLVVGSISGSHVSVSGPAAGLAAVVAAQIANLGSFDAFLGAVIVAGVIQLALGAARAGLIARFFPSSVIMGLLAAIGIILILKQLPHLVGHDPDPMGEMAFQQPDGQTTFTELIETVLDIQAGVAVIGILSLALLLAWNRLQVLKRLPVPAPLVVVILGVVANWLLGLADSSWVIESTHLVSVPVADSLNELSALVVFPDWEVFANPECYIAAITLALVASLETLLNLEAVDKLDTQRRVSPPNRELVAQGVGNIVAAFIGGLPITSVIVRSSVNVSSGAKTRASAIFHGGFLLLATVFVPALINTIPLASLAAILITAGFKLASLDRFVRFWRAGPQQFAPFIITIVAIVFTDLLIGILVGLGVSLLVVLHNTFQNPLRKILEHHISGDVLRIELANVVTFFHRARIEHVLGRLKAGDQVLLDARTTDYIDPDVLDLIDDFRTNAAKAREIDVSMLGFKEHYDRLSDAIQYVDFSSTDVRDQLTPDQVINNLKSGNERFRTGRRLTRDLMRQVEATSEGQSPMAVVLSCIDSRAPVEMVFDAGIGDLFSVRLAGNVINQDALGSMEFATAIAGVKLVVVLGHTSCGAVKAAVDFKAKNTQPSDSTGCAHLDPLVEQIQASITEPVPAFESDSERASFVDGVTAKHVRRMMSAVKERSVTLRHLVEKGDIALVGGIYDIRTGAVAFFDD